MFKFKKTVYRLLCLCFICAVLFPAQTAWADDAPTAEIRFVKLWQDDSRGERPESVTMELYAGSELIQTATLSGDADSQSWLGSFDSVPVYDGGRTINYTVGEVTAEGYKSIVSQQPKPASLSLSSWGEKITPASNSSYPIGSHNILLAKKGGSYFVWTRAKLDATQQEHLIYLVNTASLPGLGKELSFANTLFRSGLPAVFEDSGVSINGSSGDVVVEFSKTSDWSLFYSGLLGITEAREAVIENSLLPSVTPTPLPTVQPSPQATASPQPVISLSVKKLWRDRDRELRPKNVEVEIYRERELWKSVILNEGNDWSYSWQAENRNEGWSVKEKDVPAGYNSEVSREGNGFVITNTAKELPATGDVSPLEFYVVTGLLSLMGLTVIVSFPVLIIKAKKE